MSIRVSVEGVGGRTEPCSVSMNTQGQLRSEPAGGPPEQATYYGGTQQGEEPGALSGDQKKEDQG